MGRVYDAITQQLADFIAAQPLFFVATTPGADGHVNVSPKGLDTFRMLDPCTVAWLDLTGSGIETVSHLRADGRITIMFCAFEGPPSIVRLYGRGEILEAASPAADELMRHFPAHPGARAVIRVALERISTSCGYGVPVLRYQGPRDQLIDWAAGRGPAGLEVYRAEHNTRSIDALPGLP